MEATAEKLEAPSPFLMLPIDHVEESPSNPRKTFTEIDELAEDLKKRGMLQPVLVRHKPGRTGKGLSGYVADRYQLVFGHRRFRAAKKAGLTEVPALLRELTDQEVLEAQLVENSKRADIHPMEEAEGYERLHKVHKLSAEEIAAKVGKSKAFIYARMKLLALAPEAREAFYAAKLSPSVALYVARIPDAKQQKEAVAEIVGGDRWNGPMSARQAQEYIHRTFMLALAEAPFDTKDADLVPAAGACTACPHRAGNQPELFDDVKKDTCTKPSCFQQKAEAERERKKAKLVAEGVKVLDGKQAETALYSSQYVKLDDRCWQDPKSRTYAQLLKKAGEEKVQKIAALDRHGEVRELVTKEAAAKALKAAGVKAYSSGGGQRYADDRKRQKAQRHRLAVVQACFAKMQALHDAAGMDQDFWVLLLKAALGHIGWDNQRLTVVRRGLLEKADAAKAERALLEHAKTLKPHEIGFLVLELLLATAHGGNWSSGYGKEFLDACALFEVDRKAVEGEVKLAKEAGKKEPDATAAANPKCKTCGLPFGGGGTGECYKCAQKSSRAAAKAKKGGGKR